MFTGIVEEMGSLVSRDTNRFTFAATPALTSDMVTGESVAVNGCCLTVVAFGPGWFASDAVPETLARTSLGELVEGDLVNLERALRLGDRLGGHLVSGHVDTVGEVVSGPPELRIRTPSTVLIAEKGSITVDGVSLTVVDLDEESFAVAVIPHTAEVTTLGQVRAGSRVNLEFDLIARHVARLMGHGLADHRPEPDRQEPDQHEQGS